MERQNPYRRIYERPKQSANPIVPSLNFILLCFLTLEVPAAVLDYMSTCILAAPSQLYDSTLPRSRIRVRNRLAGAFMLDHVT